MKLGCNHPVRPLAPADVIGLDDRFAVMNVFNAHFRVPNFRAAPVLNAMVAAGHLGRRSVRGFYTCARARAATGAVR